MYFSTWVSTLLGTLQREANLGGHNPHHLRCQVTTQITLLRSTQEDPCLIALPLALSETAASVQQQDHPANGEFGKLPFHQMAVAIMYLIGKKIRDSF